MKRGGSRPEFQNLAIIGPIPPPSGGMATQTRQLRELLSSEGLEVIFIPVNPPYRPRWISRLRWVRSLFRLLDYMRDLMKNSRHVALAHVMANSGWSWYLYAMPAVWLLHMRGVPVILNYRGGGAEPFFQKAFARVRPTLSRVDVVIVPSRYLQEVFAKRGIETVIVHNIVDVDRFRRSAIRDIGEKDMAHIIVCRNLEPIYGIDTAISAFALVKESFPNVRMTIAGSGSEYERLVRLCGKYDVSENVNFTGALDHAAMADLYAEADIFLNTSRVDNMPNSILEAMACGVPIVTTAAGGIPYIVRDGETAVFVQQNDPAGTARAVLDLICDPERRRLLADHSFQEVQKYTWPSIREVLFNVYAEAVARKKEGRIS